MTFRRIFTRISKTRKHYKTFMELAFSRKYLFYTNVLLSASISTFGDLIEQSYELHTKEIEEVDYSRTAHMGFSGSVAGVICHNWYKVLDKVITGRSVDMVVKKVLLDQFISSPIVILSFFATVAIFEDDPWANFTEEVSDKFITLYKAEWVVWPPAQVINFYLLPLRFRVAYDNTISLAYDIYTSHVKHSKSQKSDKSSKELNKNNENDKFDSNEDKSGDD